MIIKKPLRSEISVDTDMIRYGSPKWSEVTLIRTVQCLAVSLTTENVNFVYEIFINYWSIKSGF